MSKVMEQSSQSAASAQELAQIKPQVPIKLAVFKKEEDEKKEV